MGLLDYISRGIFSKRDDSASEELVPGPMHTEDVKPRHPSYGRFGGPNATADLRYRNLQESLKNDDERIARHEAAPEGRPDPQLMGHAERLESEVKEHSLFQQKTHSTLRKLEKLEGITSAQTPYQRSTAKAHFRQYELPKIERQAQKYFHREHNKILSERDRLLRRLVTRGKSEGEIKRAMSRFEEKERRLYRTIDEGTLGRSIRGIERRIGGSGSWHPKR